jgi:hypothetical protein
VPADLDHIIVRAIDPRASAAFLAELLGAPVLPDWGPFVRVQTSNHVTWPPGCSTTSMPTT